MTERPLVRTEALYRVRVTQEVTARVEAIAFFTRSEIADYFEIDDADVDPAEVEAYATECEEAVPEDQFEMVEIVDWDSADVEILSTELRRIVPPSFVELPGLETPGGTGAERRASGGRSADHPRPGVTGHPALS